MSKKLLLSLLVLTLMFSFTFTALAQESAVKGNLSGVVTDTTGAVIPGSKVTVTGGAVSESAETNAEGKFLFKLLPPGFYQVKIEKQGFKSQQVKAAEVLTGKTSGLNITLEPGQVSEVVEVSTTASTVDTTSTTVQANLTDQFYASVPVARNVAALFRVSPGVASGGGTGASNPSISGGSGLENMYMADGVNITDPAFGGLGIFTRRQGSVGSGINLTFIKEVQVKTGGFEPQYGEATGGIVQIVTKSGSSQFHGAVGGYAAPADLETFRKHRDDFDNLQRGKILHQGDFDASAELGGYIPGFKEKLFFFGSYNPTWGFLNALPPTIQSRANPVPVGLSQIFGGKAIGERQLTHNYSGKLTYKLNENHTIESSIFGDPTHTGIQPTALNTPNTTGFSKLEFNTRNWVVRWNGVMSPTWLVNASFTWNHNRFTETPASDVFQVTDRTISGTSTVLQGFGFLENHNSQSFAYNIDTSKVVKAGRFGEHTFSIGFRQELPNYDNVKSRSGGRYVVPSLNATGTDPGFACNPADVTCPIGKTANAQLQLRTAASSCTLCPLMNIQGVDRRVRLSVSRGEFGPDATPTEGDYRAAWFNDSWAVNKYLTISAGLRWEQYEMIGTSLHYAFTDNWSPRLGFTVDPFGDRKTKLYANFGRYDYKIPLDVAIRSLSSELDLLSLNFAPQSDATGRVVINSVGSVNPILDQAHLLNNAVGGLAITPIVSAQAGTGFAPGTRQQYEDEYLVGFEHQFKNDLVVSVRYIDRRLQRVVEDVSGLSPEGANAGIDQPFIIGNPNRNTDIFVNLTPTVFTSGTAAPCTAPGSIVSDPVVSANGDVLAAGQAVCFSPNANGQIGGTFDPNGDGIPDGFPNVSRKYQAMEFEVNKSFSKNWLMRTNFRVSRLKGNYEGAFRNDNGQTDPSISSLFDFTEGVLDLLGDQFKPGKLPTDRHFLANGYFSYLFDKGMMKGLTVGNSVTIQQGTPNSEFIDHPTYGNAGEVPLGGRGKLGRTPVVGQVDLHADYVRNITEKYRLRIGTDLFNVANTKPATGLDQNRDLSFDAPGSNKDFQHATGFQRPFYARFSVKFEF